MLFHIPPPRTASTLKAFSPVPKYMILLFVGSWQIEAMARLLKKSFTNVQVAGDAVISLVFHTPPSMPPTHTVLLVTSARSTHMARMRPLVTPLPARVLPLDGPVA